ncbi:MAG: isoprenyl transferase [Alphaproteobacteria bacterium]
MSSEPKYSASVPLHIAIIMDGNGRWAKARHRPRIFGHQEGVKTVRRVVEHAANIGVKCLTLYSFSTENWTRPKAEISGLFLLLKQYVDSDLEKLNKNNVRVRIIGRRKGLRDDLLSVIKRVEDTTKDNTEFFLNIAFNYGGRDDILRAIGKAAQSGADLTALTEEGLSAHLDTADIPDPDLVIRTSGEKRISNFLLWQAAYAEFVFTDVLWPDFSNSDLEESVLDFQSRNRRFGSVNDAEVA